jgi:hypothetical protein
MVPKGHATTVSEEIRDEATTRFLAECTVDVRGRTPVEAIWTAWRGWAKGNQVAVGRARDFTRSLEASGIAIVSYDGTAFAVGVGIASGAAAPCRYCRRLIVVGEKCDCRLDAQLDGWEGPGARPEERGASLPANKLAEPAAEWAKTAPDRSGLRTSGAIKASRHIDLRADMDNHDHGGAHWQQRTPGGAPSATINKVRSWKNRFSQIPIPRQSVRLRNGAMSTPVNIGITREDLEQPQQEITVIDAAAIDLLLRRCSGKTYESTRDVAILRVFYDAGTKLSEMAALWLQNVDIGAGTVDIKGSTARTVRLDVVTIDVLREYLAGRKLVLARAYDDVRRDTPAKITIPREALATEWLWIALNGTCLTPTEIDAMLERRCRRAGFGEMHAEGFVTARVFPEIMAADQDFGTFHRIGVKEGESATRARRFESAAGWATGTAQYIAAFDRRPEPDLLVGDDKQIDDAGLIDFVGPSEEEEEEALEAVYGLPAGTLAAERALETEAEEAARLAAEADALTEAWRKELKCSHCGKTGILRKGLCDPCRQYQRRNRQLPPPAVLLRRGWQTDAPIAK